ncbi:MAG: hypothetical protein QOJ45_19 [Verrucomicrobiota bacterium]|jgi:hypothetical protein
MMKKLKNQRTSDKEVANRVEKNILIELSDLAVKQVVWYSENFGRDPRDVVSGIVAGAVERLRERLDETSGDATASVLEEDVIRAWRFAPYTDRRVFNEIRRLRKGRSGDL